MRTILHTMCAAVLVVVGACGGQAATTTDTDPVSNTVPVDTPETSPDILPPAERTEAMIALDVWQAIADNDVDLAQAYAPSIDTVGEACPEMWANPEGRAEIERDMGNMNQALSEEFANCRELLDFATVEPPEPEWDHITDNDDCSGLASISNGRIAVDIARGRVELSIQIVTLHDGRMYLGDAPRCWLDEGE